MPDVQETTDTPPEGQEPTSTATDTAPSVDPASQASEPKVFDEAYVKKLREEAAGNRTRANELQAQLDEIADRDKTDQQRLEDRAASAEERATKAETELLRLTVAASKGLTPDLAEFLTGSTQEEMEAQADRLLEVAKPKVDPSTFDGGARQTATDTAGLSPEAQHRETLKQMFGRA